MHEIVYFYPQGHKAHNEPGHPERPERVEVIRNALEQAGWWQPYPHLNPLEIPPKVLQAVHTPTFLARLEQVCRRGQHYDMDTYTTPESWELALSAAGGAIAVATSVWVGSARRGFALTRPPGHHATHDQAMGFCLLNNVALAAQYLIHEEGAQRLAIVDVDLHHGNGTQDIFYRRKDVFYSSTHQYPHYPGTGSLDEIGKGEGVGYTANFPLPPFSGDKAFQAIMEELLMPLLNRYQPEMILVSYGFDPHWRDPLGSLLLSASGFHNLVKALTTWADDHCKGRIAVFLEGGYDLEAARVCSLAVVAALLNKPWQDDLGSSPNNVEREYWKTMVQQAKQLWKL